MACINRLPQLNLRHNPHKVLLIDRRVYREEGEPRRRQHLRRLNDQEELYHELLHIVQRTALASLLADVLLPRQPPDDLPDLLQTDPLERYRSFVAAQDLPQEIRESLEEV